VGIVGYAAASLLTYGPRSVSNNARIQAALIDHTKHLRAPNLELSFGAAFVYLTLLALGTRDSKSTYKNVLGERAPRKIDGPVESVATLENKQNL
jgi:hypothetical protein